MRLAADASPLIAESLRSRGEWLITHQDLELYIAPPAWSEVIHEIARRIDSMIRHGRIAPSNRLATLERTTEVLRSTVTIVTEAEYSSYEAEARDRIPRDPNDWPTVALAIALGTGIWSVDDDFF